MSKSKIAIVVAPSTFTWERFTAIADIIRAVSAANGIALIIPGQNAEDGIEAILQMADGVVLICPEGSENGQVSHVEPDDNYVHAFGCLAIETGINPVIIIGDRNFFGSDKEWQNRAFFARTTAPSMTMADTAEFWETLAVFVETAQARSAFRRLGRHNRSNYPAALTSPVTHH